MHKTEGEAMSKLDLKEIRRVSDAFHHDLTNPSTGDAWEMAQWVPALVDRVEELEARVRELEAPSQSITRAPCPQCHRLTKIGSDGCLVEHYGCSSRALVMSVRGVL